MRRILTLFLFLLKFGGGHADHCGQLIAKSKEVPVFSEAKLYFYGKDVNDFYTLQHKERGGVYQNVPSREYEEVRSSRQILSVLKIHRSQFSDSGIYRVWCWSGHYSTEAEIIIKAFPPGPPVFGNTETVASCVGCISGWVGKQVFVTCSTWNGTEPVIIEIRKNNMPFLGLSLSKPAIGETKGLVSFLPVQQDHGAELQCRVGNNVSSQPLITTTRLYIKKLPDNPIVGSTASVEGVATNISCTSNGGRPAPSINFQYNNTQYALARAESPVNDGFFVESVLSKVFSRYDNRKNIKCCSRVSQDSQEQCTSKQLQVSFPPTSAKLEKLHDISKSSELTKQVIQCTVGESFPSSSIEWGGLENTHHNISDSYSKQGKYGSVEKIQAVYMLLSPADNGLEITCTARNEKFPSARPIASFTLNVTYAPVLTITPGENVSASAGDEVSILCSVNSNPPSSIGWYNGTELIHKVHRGLGLTDSLKLDLYNISFTTPSTFTCVADNGIGEARRQSITVFVREVTVDQLEGSEDRGSSSGMIVGVLCALVLMAVVGVALVVVALRRRRKHEVRLHSDMLQIRIEERQPSISPQVEEPIYNNIHNMNALDDSEEKNMYAQVKKPANTESKAPKELVYAELELNDDVTKPCPVIKPTSQTEYVTIDFSKKSSSSSEESQIVQE